MPRWLYVVILVTAALVVLQSNTGDTSFAALVFGGVAVALISAIIIALATRLWSHRPWHELTHIELVKVTRYERPTGYEMHGIYRAWGGKVPKTIQAWMTEGRFKYPLTVKEAAHQLLGPDYYFVLAVSHTMAPRDMSVATLVVRVRLSNGAKRTVRCHGNSM